VTPDRIQKGQALYREHRALLDQVSARYNVQPHYIVALWGIETSFGKNTGGFNVVEALATLAYDGRRAEFFRSELMQALKILEEGHITPAAMKGSWAGAMGQNQFMPSSFFNFAVDGNGDGRTDIWTSLPDVFASTANYLSKSGWKGDERWGRAVSLPSTFPKSLSDGKTQKPLSQWAAIGVTLPGGEALPARDNFPAGIAAPDGVDGRAFLVYNNFQTTLKWNRSTYFALSVGLLADAIASGADE
jgi:membrane-bound lytic murein transglycosylase B